MGNARRKGTHEGVPLLRAAWVAAERYGPAPQIGAGTLALALLVVATSWMVALLMRTTGLESPVILPLALCLVAAVVVAHRFPIYLRHKAKIVVFTIPLFLIAALLPPPLAAIGAGLGVLLGELAVRDRTGNQPSVIATAVGRWTVVAMLGSLVAHVPVADGAIVLRGLLLLAAALLLFSGDLLTAPLVIAPISGEKPGHIIVTCAREAGPSEAMQYLVGVFGALIALQQAWAVALLAVPTVLVYLMSKKEVDPDTYQLLESMADAVDLRDPYRAEHSRRVAELTRSMLQELGVRGQEAAFILMAARLHDIGKIGVPDELLLKDGPLTPDQRAVLETHAERGAELLKHYPDFARGVELVRHHHERWDGAGYPDRLAGTDIPFGARMIAVADAFDALTSDRSYRRALSPERAAAIMLEGSSQQWDPSIVQALLRSLGDRPGYQVEAVLLRVMPDEAAPSDLVSSA